MFRNSATRRQCNLIICDGFHQENRVRAHIPASRATDCSSPAIDGAIRGAHGTGESLLSVVDVLHHWARVRY